MKIFEGVSLKNWNTFGVDAIAERLYVLEAESELSLIKESSCQILGGGSNILFTKNPKTIVQIAFNAITVKEESDTEVIVSAEAGAEWADLVWRYTEQNISGIENLALIPGLCGAAPIQNIGAYGVELKDVLVSVKAFDRNTKEFVEFKASECEFGYRDSLFKRANGRYVIVSIALRLSKIFTPNLSYKALSDFLANQKTPPYSLREVRDAVIAIRQSKLPDPKIWNNAGSFFKNPVISIELFEKIKEKNPSAPSFFIDNGTVKIPAGWLIEVCGWKNKPDEGVGVHSQQALVIVRTGTATGADVWEYAQKIQADVYQKFGIQLTPEVNIW